MQVLSFDPALLLVECLKCSKTNKLVRAGTNEVFAGLAEAVDSIILDKN